MKKPLKKPLQLRDFSDIELADLIGAIDVESRAIAKREKALREEWKRRELVKIVGSVFEVLLTPVDGERVDIVALREKLGDGVAEFLVPTHAQKFCIKASVALVKEAA